MQKNIIIALIANFGIILQNTIHIHGWIFYLLFTAYLLLVKTERDIFKLLLSFSLGIVLSILIWELTGLLLPLFGNLQIAMPIASFVGIWLVLSLKRQEVLNMSSGFFIGLIAYYGIAKAPSLGIVLEIALPGFLGIVFAFIAHITEKRLHKRSVASNSRQIQTNN